MFLLIDSFINEFHLLLISLNKDQSLPMHH
ncbi:hypothetical protein ABIC80_002602 [Kosakonia sp. 1610]